MTVIPLRCRICEDPLTAANNNNSDKRPPRVDTKTTVDKTICIFCATDLISEETARG